MEKMIIKNNMETLTQTPPVQKITPNDAILRMLASMNSDSKDDFYKVAESYSKGLAWSSPIRQRIDRYLKLKPKKFMPLSDLTGNIKKLISEVALSDNENVYLNEQTKSFIDTLLFEWKNAETYRYHNIPLRNKILFHGITGNGKTTMARHIARLSGLPFIEINADNVVEGRLGDSSSNIHSIFNEVQVPCIMFWDEVDTIGRLRGRGDSSSASMENERMVNSMLTNMEKLHRDTIFIGATNRREVLDSAFLRRFDIEYELLPPTEDEKDAFIKQMMEYYKLPQGFSPKNCKEKQSYSDIKLLFTEYARKFVLDKLKNDL